MYGNCVLGPCDPAVLLRLCVVIVKIVAGAGSEEMSDEDRVA